MTETFKLPNTIREYVQSVVDIAGSDLAVGKFLGLADGSRVGTWRKGTGRPSELLCVKMARWQGHDPLAVLRLAEYHEMADLLEGTITPQVSGSNMHSVKLLQSQLHNLRSMIDLALNQTETMEVKQHVETTPRHTTRRR